MALHSAWRDTQAWRDYGLPLSTTNNEAAKLYDASLTQYVGWYEDPSVGGLENACAKMLEADPDFVMGHVMSNGLDLMGTGRSVNLDPEFQAAISFMVEKASSEHVNSREKKHVAAISTCADGFMETATRLWEEILVEFPNDMLAIKFAHDAYFYMGQQRKMRDSIARVLPHWKATMPLYGYLMGMHSFGLVETNMFDDAERVSRKGLEINRRDAWSTHSLAHVLEVTGRHDEGIAFMSSTVQDWSFCGMLAAHNFWHWALYHIEKGEYQGALDIFDAEISQRAKSSGAMLDLVDASSLLYRLEMEGVNVGDRWQDVHEISRSHLDDHLLAFNDVHFLMSCLGAKQKQSVDHFMTSLKEYSSTSHFGTNRVVTASVGETICKALVAYENGDYDKAADRLNNCRYEIVLIGGSDAQRDILNQFLIHTAMKSPERRHKLLARQLLYERKALKENSPLTDRLMAKALAQHID